MGASGLLGSELYYYFKKNKHITYGTYFKTKRKNLIKLNLLNNKDLYLKLLKYNPDIIINCVALTDVNKCERNFNKCKIYNQQTAKNLADSLKRLNKKIHLIYISTDQVYNNRNVKKLSKEGDVNVSNNYSKSKYLAEIETRKYKHHTIIRTNFFGKGKYSKKKSFSDHIFKLLKNKKKIMIPNNIFFNPISINILVKCIRVIMLKKIFGTFNLGSNEKITKYQFGLEIAKLQNFNSKKIIGYKSLYKINKRPLNTSMNISKLKNKIKIKIPKIKNQLKN